MYNMIAIKNREEKKTIRTHQKNEDVEEKFAQ